MPEESSVTKDHKDRKENTQIVGQRAEVGLATKDRKSLKENRSNTRPFSTLLAFLGGELFPAADAERRTPNYKLPTAKYALPISYHRACLGTSNVDGPNGRTTHDK